MKDGLVGKLMGSEGSPGKSVNTVASLTVKQLGQLLAKVGSLVCSNNSASRNMRYFIFFPSVRQ